MLLIRSAQSSLPVGGTGASLIPRIRRVLSAGLAAALYVVTTIAWAVPPAPATNLRVEDSPVSAGGECAQMKAGWIFCSGFEEGTLDIWDDYDGNPQPDNTVLADPGPLHVADNHVMRLRVPAGRGNADLVKVLPQSHDRLFARWYVQWEPGYDFTAQNHGSGLNAGDRSYLGRSGERPDGTDWFSSWIDHTTSASNAHVTAYTYFRGMNCDDASSSCYGDYFPRSQDPHVSQPALVTGRWYCIEMMIDAGTPVTDAGQADGVLNVWIDGLEIGPWRGLWFRTVPTLKIGIFWLSLFHHGTHSAAGIMLDNVVASTDRIGCVQ